MKKDTIQKNNSIKISRIFIWIFLVVLFINEVAISQEKNDEGVVTYSYRNNGKVREGASLEMFYKNGIVSYKSGWRRGSGNKEKHSIL